MPYPDAKYPPAKVESDRMRLALSAIRKDCHIWLTDLPPAGYKKPLVAAIWDCARTALGEGER